ncbi:hypothetical protein RF11_03189 [Thelohanellus kitauei]|uniref:Uncharacterized protein n=1 Tax=Thelohanellus kitauei TaxID=669202 RepID=A0A0C2JCZ6_THEKT|nr:hypothetical protein RF11_03189 [Thelohanellus kitauei]
MPSPDCYYEPYGDDICDLNTAAMMESVTTKQVETISNQTTPTVETTLTEETTEEQTEDPYIDLNEDQIALKRADKLDEKIHEQNRHGYDLLRQRDEIVKAIEGLNKELEIARKQKSFNEDAENYYSEKLTELSQRQINIKEQLAEHKNKMQDLIEQQNSIIDGLIGPPVQASGPVTQNYEDDFGFGESFEEEDGHISLKELDT